MEAAGPTTSVKTFDINYNVIDTTNLISLAPSTLTLNRSAAASVTGPLTLDAGSGSYFGTSSSSSTTYQQANVMAINAGGHLAIVNSAGQFTALKSSADTGAARNILWVDLLRDPTAASAGVGWKWADGSALDPSQWVGGEPDSPGAANGYAFLVDKFNTGASTMGLADVPANYTNAGPPLPSTEFESAEFTHVGFTAAEVIDFTGANRQVLINGMGGADTITGGSGNDTIKVPDTTFTSIAGGAGFDMVEFTAAATVHVNGGVGNGASQWHLTATSNGVNTYVYYDASNAATTAKLLIDASITNVVV